MGMKRLIVISDCTRECPFIKREHTAGTGFGEDYLCTKVEPPRKIVGYIEWESELPKHGTFPKWCPLQEAEEGMYLEPKAPTCIATRKPRASGIGSGSSRRPVSTRPAMTVDYASIERKIQEKLK